MYLHLFEQPDPGRLVERNAESHITLFAILGVPMRENVFHKEYHYIWFL